MIVEDEVTIRNLLGETIEKWGHTIVKVETFDNILHLFISKVLTWFY